MDGHDDGSVMRVFFNPRNTANDAGYGQHAFTWTKEGNARKQSSFNNLFTWNCIHTQNIMKNQNATHQNMLTDLIHFYVSSGSHSWFGVTKVRAISGLQKEKSEWTQGNYSHYLDENSQVIVKLKAIVKAGSISNKSLQVKQIKLINYRENNVNYKTINLLWGLGLVLGFCWRQWISLLEEFVSFLFTFCRRPTKFN